MKKILKVVIKRYLITVNLSKTTSLTKINFNARMAEALENFAIKKPAYALYEQ